jgi:molecular chaperone DnaK
MTPEELSAEVLKSLKLDVQTSMGEEVRAAVITVPAAFENPQTSATQKAAQLAGFTRSPLLLEPVAASLAYGFQSESENVYWLVYDFGGGTFDAAIMRIRDGLIQVVNHDGDNFLGGKLIDWDIVTKKLVPAITSMVDLPDFRRGNPRWTRAIGKMKRHAERAKIEVCRSRSPSEIYIEALCEDDSGKTIEFTYTLTPQDVEEISKPFIERSLSLCRKTLQSAGLTGSNVERILMVGGTTLNPWVREAVHRELGSQLEYGVDPVTVVARGAAIFASTQSLPTDATAPIAPGTWRIEIEHKPVGNVADPDIGGRVQAPAGRNLDGYTIEFVDSKTRWRSGRIRLAADGVFMTQLFAEKQRRHEYLIELCDAAGTLVKTEPDRVAYTLGVIPEEHPPAAMTIGVGMANGDVATFITKGSKLPMTRIMDHYSVVALQAGRKDDVLRIPLLEGEHLRAERNHGIGTLEIRGDRIRRDLPIHSQIEISLTMDTSQQLCLKAYVSALDEEFEIAFDPQMKHNELSELRKQAQQQRDRLTAVREKARHAHTLKAEAALSRVDDQQMLGHIDTLLQAAETDLDAVAQLDRRVRELAAEVDAVEDAVEWPNLLAKAETSRRELESVVQEHGQPKDRDRLRVLIEEFQRVVEAGDPDQLRRHIQELDGLWFQVMDRRAGFHVARFNWLVERVQTMRDVGQAEQIVAQGRRAINSNDVDALKAANRQLLSLLPREAQVAAQHANYGGTIMRG